MKTLTEPSTKVKGHLNIVLLKIGHDVNGNRYILARIDGARAKRFFTNPNICTASRIKNGKVPAEYADAIKQELLNMLKDENANVA